MLPKASRAAWVSAETGFHWAITRSTEGKLSVGTNVLAMKVSGNRKMNEAFCTTSGVGTISPT